MLSAASTHMQAVARGFICRRRHRETMRKKFTKIFDENSQFYYFQDNFTGETQWKAPRTAYCFCLLPQKIDIRDNGVMQQQAYGNGPMVQVSLGLMD